MPSVSNLFLISALLCIVQLGVLWSLIRSDIAGIREWCIANIIAFLAFILYALGRELPPLIAYEVANATYALATSAMVVGFCRFFGRQVPWRTLVLTNVLLIAAIAFFHYVHNSFAWRTISVSVSQIVFLAFIIGTLVRSRKRWTSPYPYLFTAGMAGVVAIGHVARALVYLGKQDEMISLLQPSPWNLAFLIFGTMVLPVLTMGAVMVVHDRMLAKAEHAANRDFLTGAWSRRAFFEFAERELALLVRTGGKLSLLVMDVDHFKSINDRWGHAAGDQVLVEVVATAATVIRGTDYFARIGGEEFAVLLPATGRAGAERIAERLRSALDRQAIQAAGATEQVTASFTVSVGVTELHEQMSFAEGLQRADAALYRAKQAGRNRVMTQMDEDEPALQQG